jgi:microcin C transport system substrate-binding protein
LFEKICAELSHARFALPSGLLDGCAMLVRARLCPVRRREDIPGFTHFDYVNPNAPRGGEIRMVPPTRPSNFDKFNPFTLKGNAPYNIAGLLFDTLLVGNSDEPTTAYGLLAEDVEVAPDKLSAVFRLNPRARFHDGKPVLAADVVHSFRTLISKEAAPQYRTIYAEVKDATAVAERTVRFDFASPNPELPLVVGGMAVFSRDWAKRQTVRRRGVEIPIGSGRTALPTPHGPRHHVRTRPELLGRRPAHAQGPLQLRPHHVQDLPGRDRFEA